MIGPVLTPARTNGLGTGPLLILLLLCPASLSASQSDDQELQQRASTLTGEGRLGEAIPLWEELVRRDPQSVPRVLNLALAYSNAGRVNEAAARLEDLYAAGIRDAACLNLLGKLRAQMGHPERALPHLYDAVASDPSDEIYHLDLARQLIGLRRHEEARSVLDDGLSRLSSSYRLLYMKGVLEFQAGNAAAASDIYRQLVQSQPQFEPAYIAIGNLLLQQGRTQEAASSLRQALDLGLNHPVLVSLFCDALLQSYPGQEIEEVEVRLSARLEKEPWDNAARLILAEYWLGLERVRESLEQLETILEVQPDHVEALYLSGKALKSLGQARASGVRLSRAAVRLQSLAAGTAPDSGTLYQLSLVYLEMGELDRAIESIRKALDLSPEDPLFHITLARFLAQDWNTQGALQHYRKAVELAPSSYSVLSQYGLELARRDLNHEAVDILNRALAVRPNYPLLMEISRILLLLDRRVEAKPFLKQAVELAPEQPQAYYYLGRQAQSFGDYEEAARLYRSALERRPDHLEGLIRLGEVEFQQQDLAEAEDPLQKALSLEPGNVSALFWLGRVKEQSGAAGQAVRYWQQALERDPRHSASHYRLAQYYLRTGDTGQAQAHLSRFQELSRQEESQKLPSGSRETDSRKP